MFVSGSSGWFNGVHSCGQQRSHRIALGARMEFHSRDMQGVRHIETRNQGRQASIIKSTLMSVLDRCEVQYKRIGDDALQRRLTVDDVIMSHRCEAAYIHIGATGSALEQRQAFVWLVRNKGSVKTALARRLKERGRLPQIYFVESKYEQLADNIHMAKKYPEMNLPNPFDFMETKRAMSGRPTRDETWAKWGVGNPNSPYPGWGYPGL